MFDTEKLKDGLFIGWTTAIIFFIGFGLFMVIFELLSKSPAYTYAILFSILISVDTAIPLGLMYGLFHNRFSKFYFPLLIPPLSFIFLFLLVQIEYPPFRNIVGEYFALGILFFGTIASFIISLLFSIGDYFLEQKSKLALNKRKFWAILECISLLLILLFYFFWGWIK